VLLSFNMNECVGLTQIAVVHDSMLGFEPPAFQKSGMPAVLVSDSSVGFGQILPGSKPAREVKELSRQAVIKSNK